MAGTIDWRTSTLMGDEEPRDKRDPRDEKKGHTTAETSAAEQTHRTPPTEGMVWKEAFVHAACLCPAAACGER